MPIYEYQCTSCAHRFEVKQSIKDEPIKECVRCGKEVTKLISSPAIMFKGSGWYITDYSDKMKPGSGSDTSEKPAASSTDKTKVPASSEGGGTSSTTTPAPALPLRQLRARRHRRVQVHPHPARAHQAQAPHRPQAPSRFLTEVAPCALQPGGSHIPAHPPQAVQTRCPMEPQRSLRRDDRGAPGRWTPARRYADSVVRALQSWRPTGGTPLTNFSRVPVLEQKDGPTGNRSDGCLPHRGRFYFLGAVGPDRGLRGGLVRRLDGLLHG
ncbi:MAG: hypothetical protein IPL14_13310 [Nitrospira sp.]|nr:hypothetical protein [Nitrospira sp.]